MGPLLRSHYAEYYPPTRLNENTELVKDEDFFIATTIFKAFFGKEVIRESKTFGFNRITTSKRSQPE